MKNCIFTVFLKCELAVPLARTFAYGKLSYPSKSNKAVVILTRLCFTADLKKHTAYYQCSVDRNIGGQKGLLKRHFIEMIDPKGAIFFLCIYPQALFLV